MMKRARIGDQEFAFVFEHHSGYGNADFPRWFVSGLQGPGVQLTNFETGQVVNSPSNRYRDLVGSPFKLAICAPPEVLERGSANGYKIEVYVDEARFSRMMHMRHTIPGESEVCDLFHHRSVHRGPPVGTFDLSEVHVDISTSQNHVDPLHSYQDASLEWMQTFESQVVEGLEVESPEHCFIGNTAYEFTTNCSHIVARTPYRRRKVRGGLLCNPVGSGKTATALALIHESSFPSSMMDANDRLIHRETSATLVVVPSNIASQWVDEARAFFPDMNVVKITGKREHERFPYETLGDIDVVVTTFSFLCGNYYRSLLVEKFGHDHLLGRHSWQKRRTFLYHGPIIFQLMWWDRIFYDEMHELPFLRFPTIRWDNGTVRLLRGNIVWGITATPNATSWETVDMYMRMFLSCTYDLIRSSYLSYFFGIVCHCNIAQDALPPTQTHIHRVPLTAGERRLVRSFAHSATEMIQMCTYFNAEDQTVDDVRLMTLDQIQSQVQAKRSEDIAQKRAHLESLEAVVLSKLAALEALRAQGSEGQTHVLRATREVERAQDDVTDFRKGVVELEKRHAFFEKQLHDGTFDGEEDSTCPICLTAPTDVITSCGHWFCRACAEPMVQIQSRCAMCKAALTLGKLTQVVGGDFEEVGGEEETSLYGSKLMHVVRQFRDIPEDESVVMFCEWSPLLLKVKAVLEDCGIGTAMLRGNVVSRSAALKRFRDGLCRVLLVPLDSCASGLTLTCANHVFFLHALVCDEAQTRRSTYTQAVARVHRMGQDRDVHVHWFIAADTFEDRLFRSHTY